MARIGLFSIRWPDNTTLDISVANAGHVPDLEPLGFLHGAEIRGSVDKQAEGPAYLVFNDDKDALFEHLRLLEETSYEIVVALPFVTPGRNKSPKFVPEIPKIPPLPPSSAAPRPTFSVGTI